MYIADKVTQWSKAVSYRDNNCHNSWQKTEALRLGTLVSITNDNMAYKPTMNVVVPRSVQAEVTVWGPKINQGHATQKLAKRKILIEFHVKMGLSLSQQDASLECTWRRTLEAAGSNYAQ
jgi:hypothetical protein